MCQQEKAASQKAHTWVERVCWGRNSAIILPILDPGEPESSSTTEGLEKIGRNSAEHHKND